MGLWGAATLFGLIVAMLIVWSIWMNQGGFVGNGGSNDFGGEPTSKKYLQDVMNRCTFLCSVAQMRTSGSLNELAWCTEPFEAEKLEMNCTEGACTCEDLVDDLVMSPCIIPKFNDITSCRINCKTNKCS